MAKGMKVGLMLTGRKKPIILTVEQAWEAYTDLRALFHKKPTSPAEASRQWRERKEIQRIATEHGFKQKASDGG